MHRGRSAPRLAISAQVVALLVALAGPRAVAGATLDFTLQAPSVASVAYSDMVTFRGTYTCVNDAASTCPTSSQTHVATFALRPTGGTTFSTVGTVTSVFTFTSNPAGCAATCSFAFQLVWRSGRIGTTTVSPGSYDIGLSTTIGPGQLVSIGGLTITREATTSTYTGPTSGLGNTAMSLSGSVLDHDRGLSPGSGIISPDANLLGVGVVAFELYDATSTTLVAGPVPANLSSSGAVTGSPSILLPASGGTFQLRMTYAGNAFYLGSGDLDTITVAPSNTPPVLTVPDSPLVVEATSPLGAPVDFAVAATDDEDEPDPVPACSDASGATFPLGDTTVTCAVGDSGGLGDSGTFVVRVVDTTAPTVEISTAELAGPAAWFNAASNDGSPGVTVDIATADLVGVDELACTVNGVDVGPLDPAGVSIVLGDGRHTVACTATDGAGNVAGADAAFDVDQTPPGDIAFVDGDLTPGGAYPYSFVPSGPTACTATDGLSGLAGCEVGGYSGVVGEHAVVGTATDMAGNVATVSLPYAVLPWRLVGFFKPIEMTGSNALKAGGTAQLKLEVYAGGVALSAPDVIASVTEGQVSCESDLRNARGPAPKSPAGATSEAGGNGRFTIRWTSPDLPGTCWRVTVTTADGSSLAATFRLR